MIYRVGSVKRKLQFLLSTAILMISIIQAIELVTTCLEEYDYASLDGLVADSCISRLQTSLKDLTNEEKEYLPVRASDIFFSFIPSFKIDGEQQSLILGKNESLNDPLPT